MSRKDRVAEDIKEMSRFGEYIVDHSFEWDLQDFKASISKVGSNEYIYKRIQDGNITVEKIIVSDQSLKLGIIPLAPVYTPEPLATHLMLKLMAPIIIEPKSRASIYLTMPIEIGFVILDVKPHIIDTFSLTRQLYAIYGTPDNGVLCRYHLSKPYIEMPDVNPLEEAIVRVHIANYTDSISNINRMVFPAKGVDLYYSDKVYFPDVEMIINTKLVNTIANIKLVGGYELTGKVTSLMQEHEDEFIMDKGL